MKVKVITPSTEAKIKAILFGFWVTFIHMLAIAGIAYIIHDLFGPFY